MAGLATPALCLRITCGPSTESGNEVLVNCQCFEFECFLLVDRPNQEGGQGPFFCNKTWTFDPEMVEAIRPQLLRVWPNIHGNDTEDSLWKHEWEKHGTCAANDPKFGSEMLYFKQGIQWVSL